MLSRRTIRRPATGLFQTPVCTVRPCQETSWGRPTLTERRVAIGAQPAPFGFVLSSSSEARELGEPGDPGLDAPLEALHGRDHRRLLAPLGRDARGVERHAVGPGLDVGLGAE